MSSGGFAASYTSIPREFFLSLIAGDTTTPDEEAKWHNGSKPSSQETGTERQAGGEGAE